jgi:hypothetical protein
MNSAQDFVQWGDRFFLWYYQRSQRSAADLPFITMTLTLKFSSTADDFLEAQRIFNRNWAPAFARLNYRYATPVGILLLADGVAALALRWNLGLCVFLIAFGGYLILFKTVFGPRKIKKEYARYPDLSGERTMEFGEEKILVQTSLAKSEIDWARFSRFAETDQQFVLLAPPRTVFMIPRRALSSDECGQLRGLLRRKLTVK